MYLKDHLEKLEYFFEIGRTGSLRAAGERLHISQPSLTKSLKILEEAIGQPLFVRLPRGVRPTAAGETLMQYCHMLFAQLRDVEKSLEAPGDPMAGSIKVGTYDSIAIYFWPQFLHSFMTKYQNLDLELTTNRSEEIQLMVEKGELDLGLIIEPLKTANTHVVNLSSDSFRFYKSTAKKLMFESNLSAPLIYMSDAIAGFGHEALESKLSSKDKRHRKTYKTSSLESAKVLARQGLGIALLPKMVAQEDVQRKNLVEVAMPGFPKKGIGKHSIGLVYSSYRDDSSVLKSLINEIKQMEW